MADTDGSTFEKVTQVTVNNLNRFYFNERRWALDTFVSYNFFANEIITIFCVSIRISWVSFRDTIETMHTLENINEFTERAKTGENCCIQIVTREV